MSWLVAILYARVFTKLLSKQRPLKERQLMGNTHSSPNPEAFAKRFVKQVGLKKGTTKIDQRVTELTTLPDEIQQAVINCAVKNSSEYNYFLCEAAHQSQRLWLVIEQSGIIAWLLKVSKNLSKYHGYQYQLHFLSSLFSAGACYEGLMDKYVIKYRPLILQGLETLKDFRHHGHGKNFYDMLFYLQISSKDIRILTQLLRDMADMVNMVNIHDMVPISKRHAMNCFKNAAVAVKEHPYYQSSEDYQQSIVKFEKVTLQMVRANKQLDSIRAQLKQAFGYQFPQSNEGYIRNSSRLKAESSHVDGEDHGSKLKNQLLSTSTP